MRQLKTPQTIRTSANSTHKVTKHSAKRAARPRQQPASPVAAPAAQPFAAVYQNQQKQIKLAEQGGNRSQSTALTLLGWPFRKLWYSKWWLINLGVVAASILVVLSESARQSTANLRFDDITGQMQNVPHHDTALVFGAGVLPDHTPTEYLKHRVETAVDLYTAKRVDSLLMSGNNSSSHYDEPTVMKAYAVKLGVPAADVIIDSAGYNTYDSCYRAHAIFGVRSLTVVTQGYHLPRVIMTCQHLGIDTIGVAAKHTGRDWTASYLVREHISTAKAYAQIYLKPQPTVLGKAETKP